MLPDTLSDEPPLFSYAKAAGVDTTIRVTHILNILKYEMIHHIRKQTCFVLLSQVLGAQDLPLRSRLAREKSEKKCRSERQRSFDVAKLVGFQGSVNASSGCAADSLSSALPSEAFIPCRSGAKDPDEFLRVVASRTSSVLMRLPTCGVVIALRVRARFFFNCSWSRLEDDDNASAYH